VKYVSWKSDNYKYKEHILSKLSLLQNKNLIISFHKNRTQIEYILSQKFYSLLDDIVMLDLIGKYKNSEISKIYNLSQYVPLPIVIKLFNKSKTERINKHNVISVLEYIDNENNFINKKVKIAWGPGNHGDIKTNIDEHYKKHILSDERKHWLKILPNLERRSYKKYAIESFYKMTNVMVHSNGNCVHMSGFYGNVFIVGRYHEGVYGISSCYYVDNGEKTGRVKDLCFEIKFE
jgi:hypothetical protein